MPKKLKRVIHRAVAAVTAGACVVAQLAAPPFAHAAPGSSTASAGSVPPPSVSAIQSFQPDLFTGRATTSIPIAVPPGRKGVQPSLALSYASSSRNGWLGVGWSLDLGAIERSTKHGPPAYSDSDTYTFMFQGVSSDLVRIPDGTYRAKDEGLFLRFEFRGVSGWEVRDKSGTRYRFGQDAASQIVDAGRAFRWALDQAVDPNGNTMTVEYTKDGNQLYPARIRYTGHVPTGLEPANQVEFLLEDRPDVDTSYRSGFAITTSKRLRGIETRATVDGARSLARRYDVHYDQSRRSTRSLLTSLTQVGTDGSTGLPATTFSYSDDAQPSYSMSTNNGAQGQVAWNVRRASLDTGHENFGCAHPYSGLPWDAPVVVSSQADLSCVHASVGSDGSIRVDGCKDHFMHAWTWVYSADSRTIPVSFSGGEACVWREDASGISRIDGGSMPLQSGWSIIHLTGYHQHEDWTTVMSSPLRDEVDVMSPTQFIKPQLAGDVDGNGIADVITFDATSGTWTVACAQRCLFSPNTIWLSGFGTASTTPVLGDWDGDGRTDVATFQNGSWQFATSAGMTFHTGTIPAISFGGGTPLTGDFNGDGKIDLGTFNNGSWDVALSNGRGFSPSGAFHLEWGNGSQHEPLTGDFNGDGLTDVALVDKPSGDVAVAFSFGRGFAPPSHWLLRGAGPNQPHTSADFNGDGLTDIAYYDKSAGRVRYAASTGIGFGPAQALPPNFSRRGSDDGLQLADFNGDGLADPAVVNGVTGTAELAQSQGTFPDLLTTIANGLGGSTTIQYRASSSCDNTCPIERVPKLPFVLPVVDTVTVSDGLGHSYATRYQYEQGRYDAPTMEFRGFAHVEVRDADANVTITEFLQDEQTKGRPAKTEFRDAAGKTWRRAEQTWSASEPYPGVHFVKLDQTDAVAFEGNPTGRHTRSRFEYDAFGNITRATDDGDMEISGDERSAITTYATDETQWILSKPALTQALDANGTMVSQRRFAYDGINLTKEEEWLDVLTGERANGLNGSTESWFATTLTYDAYGNVATVTDALGRTTTNAYDDTGTYLTRIATTLGHTRTFAYDARLGQALSSTDQNGVTTTTEYDALGRLKATRLIPPEPATPILLSEMAYDLTTVPSRVTATVYTDASHLTPLTSHQFMDGLGRTIQTRSPAQDSSQQVVSGAVEFDDRGLVTSQCVPYLDSLSNAYRPPSPATWPLSRCATVRYTYDPLGRVLTTTNPDGSVSSSAYGNRSVTSIDANGHKTRHTQDSFGRLAQVEEFNDTETYTTSYQYDTLNNLIQVTDAKGHVTTIAYDALGRKIAMDDPDMGHWTYAYDAVDNLVSQTDARGVVTNFTYDPLNRLVQKHYTWPDGRTGQPVTYAYDDPAKPFGKGKLTGITDGSGSSNFEYDAFGRLVTEEKAIDGTRFTVHRSYDLLGRLTALTYPDGDTVDYTYNLQGGIATIDLASVTSPLRHLATDLRYNAAGQLTSITYGNGVTTDYSYDPQTLRLNHLITQSPNHEPLQDFSYAFDPLGNVTAITDRVHTGSQTFTYDPLNRLASASGAYGNLTYRYDPIGNMLEKEGVRMSYGLPDGSKPHAVTSVGSGFGAQGSGWVLTYDENGNLTEKLPQLPAQNPESIAQRLTYDAENRLIAVTTPAEESVTMTFHPGWNFFSLPVMPEDASITTLFPNFSADFEQMARLSHLTPLTSHLSFEHYVGDASFDDFSTLEYGAGYQVYCKNPSGVSLTFKGKLPTQQLSKSLGSGWQLLPSLSPEPRALSTVFDGLDYDQALAYDAVSQTLKPATEPEAARAYFVHLTKAGTFSPSLPRDPTTRFVYDGDGGRVKQTTAAGTTRFLGDVMEIGPDGATTKYVFASSQRLASIATSPLGYFTTHFYHPDHLGSSDVITDAAGAMVEHTEHLPYGAISRSERANGQTGQPANPSIGFTGQRQDASTELILFPARAYDPQLGRFLSADPFVQAPDDPQTLNRYAYCRNNPINLVDPSGYFSWKKFFGIVAAVVVSVVTGNPELGLTIWGQLLAVSAAAAAGSAIGGAIDRSLAGSGSPSSFQSPIPQSVPSPPVGPAPGLGLAAPGITSQASSLAPLSVADIAASDLPLEDSWGPDDVIFVLTGLGVSARATMTAARELGPAALGGLRSLGETGAIRLGAEEAESRGAIVIGENMDRVQTAGRALGAKVFKGQSRRGNIQFINRAKKAGETIYDIGPDFARRVERLRRGIPSEGPGYNLERQLTVGYDKLRKLWNRTGKHFGGSPF